MKPLDLVRTANRNLSRSKLRTFLTISAIFVGAFTLTLTTALGAGAQQYLNRQLGNVDAPGMFFVQPKTDSSPLGNTEIKEYDPNKTVGGNQFTASLTQTDIDKLGKLKGVESARPYYNITGVYMARDDKATKYIAGGLTQYNGLSLDLAAGRLLNNKSDANAIILPDGYLKPLKFSSAEEAIGKTVVIGYQDIQQKTIEKQVKVVGVMKKSFVTGSDIYIDDHLVKEIAAAQGQNLRFFAAFVQFSDKSESSAADHKKLISDAGAYDAISFKEQIQTITTIISAITTALNVVGIIALFAASFGIINTLLMSVYERTQEVGLMKALGMRRAKVFGLFAIEAVLVGFWGSVIAVGAGYGVSRLVTQWASSSFLKDFQGFDLLVVTPMNAVFVVLLIMLIAFLAGTLPALKASRLNPIEALRSE